MAFRTRYASLEDEDLVLRLLCEKELRPERFSKHERRRGKTPDFRVYRGDTLTCYCEVKSIEEDTWLDEQLEGAAPGEIVGGARNDPVFNRLTTDIDIAAKQFDAVNPNADVPNILALVNHDSMCDELDLIGVVTGKFLADDGTAHRIYQKFSEGKIKSAKFRIHLFCWIEEGRVRHYLINEQADKHAETVCQLMGLDVTKIKSVGP